MCGRHRQSEVQKHFDGGHGYSAVAVAETVIQNVHEVVDLLLSAGPMMAGQLQDLTLSPL